MLRQGSEPARPARRTRIALRAAVFAAAICAPVAPAAWADAPPPGSKWSSATITETDGTRLYADVLRPANLPDGAKTPVIVSVGPYFNHSGQTGVLGPVEDTPYDPTMEGPSSRFYDYINGAKVFERGYTWVQVDLRGFGGSDGCLDWGGPGEQADVKAAVEWAAKQPWSTGKVGMYGKSYDGVTGLIGLVSKPQGLGAVVSQEPVYDLYRYLYMNRVRFINSLLTPGLYDAIAGSPGTGSDTLAYNFNSLNDTARPGCPVFNHADQQDPNHGSDYWKARDFIGRAKGKTTPLFLTQGFLENNTKPDGAFDFFNNVAGPKRAWLGMWDHVRGNDKDENGRLKMGRHGWFEETMRFYDRYLKGIKSVNDPTLAVESSDGKWRSEQRWPPPDSKSRTTTLKTGAYSDDGTSNGEASDTTPQGTPPFGQGVWTFSPALKYPIHLAGVPRITADLEAPAPNANFVADLYDVDKDLDATLISRGTYLLAGSGRISFDMYGNDWRLPAGHRLGVLLAGANAEWWTHVPTGQQVTVKSAKLSLAFLACRRSRTIEGGPSIKLEDYLKNAPFPVDAETVNASTTAGFALPPAQANCTPREIAAGGPSPRCVNRRSLTLPLHPAKRRRIVSVRAYVNGRLVLNRTGRDIKTVTLKGLPAGTFRVKLVTRTDDGRTGSSERVYRGCGTGGRPADNDRR